MDGNHHSLVCAENLVHQVPTSVTLSLAPVGWTEGILQMKRFKRVLCPTPASEPEIQDLALEFPFSSLHVLIKHNTQRMHIGQGT